MLYYWRHALKDKLPQDGENVLISVDGVYYMATFIEKERLFRVKEGSGYEFYADKDEIYWTKTKEGK